MRDPNTLTLAGDTSVLEEPAEPIPTRGDNDPAMAEAMLQAERAQEAAKQSPVNIWALGRDLNFTPPEIPDTAIDTSTLDAINRTAETGHDETVKRWDGLRHDYEDNSRIIRERRHGLLLEAADRAVELHAAHLKAERAILDKYRPKPSMDGETVAVATLFDLAARTWTASRFIDLAESLATHRAATFLRPHLERLHGKPPPHLKGVEDRIAAILERYPEDTSARTWREAQRAVLASRRRLEAVCRSWVKGPARS